MMFLAQFQGFALALVFCLVALLSFAAGARAVTKRQSAQSELEAENDRLTTALCDVASSVEGIARGRYRQDF
jgi:membrane protein implicated in regulation of membrane protease activity